MSTEDQRQRSEEYVKDTDEIEALTRQDFSLDVPSSVQNSIERRVPRR